MKQSVVVTCYNKSKFILDAVTSAKEQSDVHEVVVVDDCSTDNSYTILERLDGICLMQTKTNVGVSAATRIGIERAQAGGCDYVVLLDGDDILAGNALAYYAQVICRSGVGAIYSKVARDGEDDMRAQATPCDMYSEVQFIKDPIDAHLVSPMTTTALCARPEIMTAIYTDRARVQDHQIGFSICYHSDVVARSTAKTHYCSAAVSGANISSDSQTMLIASNIVYMNTYTYVKKNKHLKQYQMRAYTQSLRLRHHKVLPRSLVLVLNLITPLKTVTPRRWRQFIIETVYGYV